jgi:serine acetyltransferase
MRKIREVLRWIVVIILFPIHIPHLVFYFILRSAKRNIDTDVERYKEHFRYKCPNFLFLLYLISIDRYFRSLFYFRIGMVASLLISWYRPGDRYFLIPKELNLGGGCIFYHPYSTVLNAERIGTNFSCAHGTTIGWGKGGRPVVGDNVQFGANVIAIGGIEIGNNVIVGAGSVIVKSIPDNCVVAGNPARIIRNLADNKV